MALFVNEIFHSIQGESSYAGWPCAFVRLSGCNLRCSYCDTRYAYEEGVSMAIPDIIARVRSYDCRLIEVTGGEPLMQEDTPRLIRDLIRCGHTVLLETNGSRDISRVDDRCVRIVDFKCPSSGEAESNDFDNLDRLKPHDELKCVIGDRADYEFAKDIVRLIRADFRDRVTIHFSPMFGRLKVEQLAEWILEDRIRVRLNLQLHKIIWGSDKRGV